MTPSVGTDCAVCGTPPAQVDGACPNCGFPATFNDVAMRALSDWEPPMALRSPTRPRRKSPRAAGLGPSPESEAIGRLAEELAQAARASTGGPGGLDREAITRLRNAVRAEMGSEPEEAARILREGSARLSARAREAQSAPAPRIEPPISPVVDPPRLSVAAPPAGGRQPLEIARPDSPVGGVPRPVPSAARPEPTSAEPPTAEERIPPADANALLEKARTLVAMIKALPPESAQALDAASRIREATELLRGGEFAKSQAVLDRLMVSLRGLSATEKVDLR